MTDREKLIELMTDLYGGDPLHYGVKEHHIADHLIANGVTFATDKNAGNKWISVEDRLPEGGKAIICLGIRGDIFIGKWMDILRKGDNVAHCHVIVGKHAAGYKCATHWMPLPELPVGNSTDGEERSLDTPPALCATSPIVGEASLGADI